MAIDLNSAVIVHASNDAWLCKATMKYQVARWGHYRMSELPFSSGRSIPEEL
jgi:hypothetical protein